MNRRLKLFVGTAIGLTLVLMAFPKRTPETLPIPIVPAPAVSVAGVAVVVELATQEQLAAQAARSASLAWSRDPFAPPVSPEPVEIVVETEEPAETNIAVEIALPQVSESSEPVAPVERPRLFGVSKRGDARWALIDGQVLREGDSFSAGYRVERISNNSVTVLLDGEELTLILGDAP